VSNYKATPEQWIDVEFCDKDDFNSACILELRARVEALEAQANHIGDINKMVPPPVATDEELRVVWGTAKTPSQGDRAIYNLGIEHGHAGCREVADPAPVAGEVEELVAELRIIAAYAAAACQFINSKTLTRAADMIQQLGEREARR
jgi:hypothetical protein